MGPRFTPEESKYIGWEARKMKWPTLEEVINCNDRIQLLTWHRHLPIAENDEQVKVISALVNHKVFKENHD
jgi:hypothetical protein